MNNLLEFLVDAKKNTYANKNAIHCISSRKESKDFKYESNFGNDNYEYYDSYFGNSKFIGQEVVYKNDKILWAMNYYGKVLNDKLTENLFSEILKPALMLVNNKNVLPLRGPKKLTIDNWKYTFESKGNINNFIGHEKIFYNDTMVYELFCEGGIIF